jgi:hypothetical protein
VQIAISAGAVDTAVVVPPPSPPGSLTQDVLGAGDGAGGNTTDVLQVNDANDKIEAGS